MKFNLYSLKRIFTLLFHLGLFKTFFLYSNFVNRTKYFINKRVLVTWFLTGKNPLVHFIIIIIIIIIIISSSSSSSSSSDLNWYILSYIW